LCHDRAAVHRHVFETQGFCPSCGGSLEVRFVEEEERDRPVCRGCGRIHYRNPVVVAGLIPAADGKIWMLRRAIEPRYGYWTFPAGYMELGETVEQAAVRETREELNLTVRLERLLGVYSFSHISTVHVIYCAEALSDPRPGSEALDIAPFSPDAIPWDDLAFATTRRALEDWISSVER
jgi:ADP-ribose pyrophosphatase YjhB (NUDIX family)